MTDFNTTMMNLTLMRLQSQITDMQKGTNDFFLVTMGMIVFLMQAGFAFLEAGAVRSKNTTNILMKNVLDSCIAALSYWSLGYSLAYGKPSNAFCGYGQWFAYDFDPANYAFWWYQFVFAATTATIVSGALAERCEFVAYLIYGVLLTTFTYPIVSHWVWATDGWLHTMGWHKTGAMIDFAGSGVVHLHGGVCAFLGAWALGQRRGRFETADCPAHDLKGHSVPFTALGGFILMFGFFAFNGGSELITTTAIGGQEIALSMVNTMLSSAAAGTTVLLMHKLVLSGDSKWARIVRKINFVGTGKWSLLETVNAVLAGMVSSCAAANGLHQWAAVVVGIGSGIVYVITSKIVVALKIDDPLEAVAVHAGGGLWGILISPILLRDTGIIYGGGENGMNDALLQLAWNCIGALAIIGWVVCTAGPLFFGMKWLNIFRVSADVETKGLDIYKHGEPAYPLVAYGHGWDENDKEQQDRVRQLSMMGIGDLAFAEELHTASRRNTVRAEHHPGQQNGGFKHDDILPRRDYMVNENNAKEYKF